MAEITARDQETAARLSPCEWAESDLTCAERWDHRTGDCVGCVRADAIATALAEARERAARVADAEAVAEGCREPEGCGCGPRLIAAAIRAGGGA